MYACSCDLVGVAHDVCMEEVPKSFLTLLIDLDILKLIPHSYKSTRARKTYTREYICTCEGQLVKKIHI